MRMSGNVGAAITWFAAALTAGVTQTSCTGSLFQSKIAAPSVYLLSAGAGGAAPVAASSPPLLSPAGAAAAPADLAVLLPRVRKGLDSDRIAVLYPDRRLDHFAGAKWSGPLDEVIEDLVVEALRNGGGLRNVSGDASAFADGYWLEIEVADFQAEYSSVTAALPAAPTIHVRLLARLGAAADRRVLGTFVAEARQSASDNRLTAIVDAYERAVDAALAQIVAGTAHALGASR